MMTQEEKNQLHNLLQKLKDEQIEILAEEYDIPEDEIRSRLNSAPEDMYDLDDGDCIIQAVDQLLWSI